MAVGQSAIAMGRTLRRAAEFVGWRDQCPQPHLGRAIQTDAKISPTNYGGPLIDLRGRVLGVLVPLSSARARERTRRLGMV